MSRSERSPLSAQKSILVAIPAHNEDRFIGSLVLKLRGEGYSVLVVDDGSSDKTAEIAEAAGAAVTRHNTNLGKTAAVSTAFEEARIRDIDALVLLDGDSQHDPRFARNLLAPILAGEADMVLGSRFVGTKSDIPRWRILGQHTLTIATNLGSGLHVSDTESGFRAFSKAAIEHMRFRGKAFSIEPEMQFEARRHGLRVVEVPIEVGYDIAIKRNPVWQGIRTLESVLRLVAEFRPLLFFSLPGLVLFLSGVGLGAHVVQVYNATLTLAIGTALITVLLCIVGMLSMFVGIMLHTMRSLFFELAER